jgi:hypothetical protein
MISSIMMLNVRRIVREILQTSCLTSSIGLMAKRKNPAAVALGKRSGKARMEKLGPQRLSETGKKAAEAQWSKPKKDAAGR